MRSRAAFAALCACAVSLVALQATAGAATVTVRVADYSFSPTTAKVAQGSSVQWNFSGPSPHNATSSMGLFASGNKPAGGTYSFLFVAAGKYKYICNIHPTQMTGTVAVPIKAAPSTGGTGTVFTVTWASTTLPTNHVADVQIRRPGSTSFVSWKSAQTGRTANFTADGGKGTYAFRARLRNTSTAKASNYSPLASITVS